MIIDHRKIRILHYSAVTLLVIGTLDPMEGSVLIATASILFATKARLTNYHYSKLLMISAISCTCGVAAMFMISSFGGLGGKEGISWWWGLLIIPYPMSWLYTIIWLLRTGFRRSQNK